MSFKAPANPLPDHSCTWVKKFDSLTLPAKMQKVEPDGVLRLCWFLSTWYRNGYHITVIKLKVLSQLIALPKGSLHLF